MNDHGNQSQEPDSSPNELKQQSSGLKNQPVIKNNVAVKAERNRPQDPRRHRRELLIGGVVGVLYGLLARIVLGPAPNAPDYPIIAVSPILTVDTMTYGFLAFVPIAIGVLSVIFTPRNLRTHYGYTSSITLMTTAFWLLTVALFALEAWICILMAAPIVLIMSQVGSRLMCWMFRQIEQRRYGKHLTGAFTILLILAPYAIAPLENSAPAPLSIREVQTQVTIHASIQTVWQNMLRVKTIQPSERTFSIPDLIGIPQPIKATLNYEEVGGVRYTQLTEGLAFDERITTWQEFKMIVYTIRVDVGKNIQPPFNQIGGPYFSPLNGEYVLEPVGNGNVILHLNTNYKLATHFNAYGGLWTDFILRDLQDQVLSVIKERSEQAN